MNSETEKGPQGAPGREPEEGGEQKTANEVAASSRPGQKPPAATVKDTVTPQVPPSVVTISRLRVLGIIAIFAAGFIVLTLVMVSVLSGPERGANGPSLANIPSTELTPDNSMELSLFFPLEGRVALEQRIIPKVEGARAMAETVLMEFLDGPDIEERSYVPDAVEVLGVYLGKDKVLYLDFTSSLTLNFQGDAVAEFLLLRALYKTLKANLSGLKGYRLLVDGREVDTIGGHIYILEGLERAVPYRLLKEDALKKG